MNDLSNRIRIVVALMTVGATGCGAAAEGDKVGGQPAFLAGGVHTAGVVEVAPVVTCTSGLDIVNVTYSGIATEWEDRTFETTLRQDLGNPDTHPWLLRPRNAENSWVGLQLPDDYPSSITALADAYNNVDPINSRVMQCTSTSLLSGGPVSSESLNFIVWDPRTGGTGGGTFE